MVCTYEEDNIDVFLKSAPPATALELLQKSVLATQDNKKQQDIKGAETPKQHFYVGRERLSKAWQCSNRKFYNQKRTCLGNFYGYWKIYSRKTKSRFGA